MNRPRSLRSRLAGRRTALRFCAYPSSMNPFNFLVQLSRAKKRVGAVCATLHRRAVLGGAEGGGVVGGGLVGGGGAGWGVEGGGCDGGGCDGGGCDGWGCDGWGCDG